MLQARQRLRRHHRRAGNQYHDIAVGYESQYDLIQAVGEPNCKALFDAWAPALHGEDLDAAARKMGPVTAHTTIASLPEAAALSITPIRPW